MASSLVWLPLAQGGGGSLMPLLTMFVPIIILFYFLMYRPQKRQREDRQRMLTELKKNERVVTVGGIHGTIVSLRTESGTLTLRLDENARVEFDISSIARRADEEPADTKQK